MRSSAPLAVALLGIAFLFGACLVPRNSMAQGLLITAALFSGLGAIITRITMR